METNLVAFVSRKNGEKKMITWFSCMHCGKSIESEVDTYKVIICNKCKERQVELSNAVIIVRQSLREWKMYR